MGESRIAANIPENKPEATWFPMKKTRLYLMAVILIGAILTCNPIAFNSLTSGGTTWQNILGLITFALTPVFVIIDNMSPEK